MAKLNSLGFPKGFPLFALSAVGEALIAEKIPSQAEGVITANPFVLPLKKFPASFSDDDKKRLTDEITSTVNNEVFPAYKQFAAFITTDYIPYSRTTLSINAPGGGKRRYEATLRRFTTTDLTAAQIHEIGLKEVDRITGEMMALAKANGYKDLASFRDHVENDPKYQPASADAIVEDFRNHIAGSHLSRPIPEPSRKP
jgi:uncharacterized protein (DUF885 family)